MDTTSLPTGTVTFLFTDIEDGGAAPGPGPRRRPRRGRKRGSPAFGCLACARRAAGTRPRSGQPWTHLADLPVASTVDERVARLSYDGFDKGRPPWLLPARRLAVLPAEAT
jgi:hypothetical protein